MVESSEVSREFPPTVDPPDFSASASESASSSFVRELSVIEEINDIQAMQKETDDLQAIQKSVAAGQELQAFCELSEHSEGGKARARTELSKHHERDG